MSDLDGLKDFQRRTVEYVCRRMLDEGARRFLVADEVGLGKTMVARGVVSRTVQRLQEQGVKRIDVVYICSNQEIARQNLDRLKLPGHDAASLSSRLTLLPLEISKLRENAVNFVSFTPGTSFEQASSGGWTKERALLLELLHPVWRLPRHKGVDEFFRVSARRSTLRWEREHLGTPDQDIAKAFAARMAGSPLRDEVMALIECGRRRNLREGEHRERLRLIGQLRRQLAECCVRELEPDLVIMDEFQRFADLLEGDSPAAELARALFGFDNGNGEFARVLLLSATPFKAYSRAGELGSAHESELRRLLGFLFEDPGRAQAVQDDFAALRDALQGAVPDEDALRELRTRVENELTQVMVRTERLACSATRDGMLEERPVPGLELRSEDVGQWTELARLHRLLREHGYLTSAAAITEYWKSAPWLAQFMDSYQFKRAIIEARAARRMPQELEDALEAVRQQLDWDDLARYGELAPANARMRALRADTVERTWDLLWLPPAMPYHRPGPPYDRLDDAPVTKRLVFSAWDVVPKAVAGFLSYEAERRIFATGGGAAENTQEARRTRERRLLDFRMDRTDGTPRPQSMATLGALAPSTTLAALGDPLDARRQLFGAELPSAELILKHVSQRIAGLLKELPDGDPRSPVDQRWYWAAPLLFDAMERDARTFWDKPGLAGEWTGSESAGDTSNFARHVELAQNVVDNEIALGRRPDDLEDVLALVAVAGPANAAARALRRVLPTVETGQILVAAARIGWGLRAVFNSPEAIAIVESELPYWRSVLGYALGGNLQAVLDEWIHVVAEDARGAGSLTSEARVLEKVTSSLLQAMTLQTSSLSVDRLDGGSDSWRSHFALRYGQAKLDGPDQSLHPQTVRRAFNSPLRPFVLTSTSVGQEGLDFHTYCHAIVHWNLPSNPVDLEQREGRVHRYKGHAVRRNVADCYGTEVLLGDTSDPWREAFARARHDSAQDHDELVPYWIFPGENVIERYVPALPYSRDAERYSRVLRELVLYRMVFGQPRQDDLIAFLRAKIGDDAARQLAELVRIDLSPRLEALTTARGGRWPAEPRR